MLKAIWCVVRPNELSLDEFAQHWFEVHGQLHLQAGHRLLGYSQTHTLIRAYDAEPKPTQEGASIVWLEDIAAYEEAIKTRAFQDAVRDAASGVDGKPLLGDPLPFAFAREHVLVDGPVDPFMIKAVYTVRRHPDVALDRFFAHWRDVHGAIAARLPGLRRYVQNHGLPEASAYGPDPHDGWAETWFNSLADFQNAFASDVWRELEEDSLHGVDGGPLFDQASTCFVLGRERFLLVPPHLRT